MYGTYESIDARPALRFERRLTHPVEAVWSAITESAELAHWFPCKVEADLRVGGQMTFEFEQIALEDRPTDDDGGYTMRGEVTELDPPRVFAFMWGNDRLRFELIPAAGGTETDLRFTVLLDGSEKAARDGAGWTVCLDRLESRLTGLAAQAPANEAAGEWREYYDEYVRQGFPAGAPLPKSTG